MAATKVSVIRTGLANLASVIAGLRRAGADPVVTENPADVQSASHVVLPGVGAFGAAMKHLEQHDLTAPLRDRIAAGRPTACVCLGLQLLFETSEESPGVRGLASVPLTIQRLPRNVRVPHFGWNEVVPDEGARIIQRGYAYFANSYCAPQRPEGWTCAITTHGIPFVAAMEKGALLACQFHPELSGEWGLGLLQRWLATSDSEAIASC